MHGPPLSADERAIHAFHQSLTNHTPSEAQVSRIEDLRSHAKVLATRIIESQPASRERSLALTHLEDAVMWAVKGIVLPRSS